MFHGCWSVTWEGIYTFVNVAIGNAVRGRAAKFLSILERVATHHDDCFEKAPHAMFSK